jgi:peptidoglycan/LPS O-acetylase OafA/YrhL
VQSSTSSRRLFHLDALRGLAALVVVLHHFRDMLTEKAMPWVGVPFIDGSKSVILFFVLSGYVLALPILNGKHLGYSSYLTRRFFRIYVPYAGAVLIAATACHFFQFSNLPLTPAFYRTWHTALHTRLILHQLVFYFDGPTGAALNFAFWTLKIECIMSLIFPMLCWAIFRFPPLLGWAIAFSCNYIGVGRFDGHLPIILRSHTGELLWPAAFLFGILLARDRNAIMDLYRRAWRGASVLFLFVVIFEFYRGYTVELLNIPACCGVIILADNSRARHWLSSRIPVYFGRISYSIYLMHGTVLLSTLILLYGHTPLWVIAGVYLAATWIASHLYCVFIEETSMSLGKRLTYKFEELQVLESTRRTTSMLKKCLSLICLGLFVGSISASG